MLLITLSKENVTEKIPFLIKKKKVLDFNWDAQRRPSNKNTSDGITEQRGKQ